MSSLATMQSMKTPSVISSTRAATLRLPSISAALQAMIDDEDNLSRVRYVGGPVSCVEITLVDAEMTIGDTAQGGSLKLLDFPLGFYKVRAAFGSLTFTTTSVIADTLNASKSCLWAVGTAAQALTSATGITLTKEGDIIPATSFTSSATIDVVNTATIGYRDNPVLLDGASTAKDVYLNVGVPTASDIDADATVLVNGTITIYFEDLGLTTAAAAAARMPTASIWADCPWDDIRLGKIDGFCLFEDFLGNFTQAANVAAAASTLPSPFAAFTGATAGGTVTMATDAPYGVVKLNNTTDDETTCLVMGGRGTSGICVLEAGKRLWLEARIKINTIADTKLGLFFGLGEEGLCVTVGVCAADDSLVDKDLVGFWHNAADGDKLDCVYNTQGGGGITSNAADAVTLVADTYVNLAIVSDGTSVRMYANGTLVSTAIALSATNFPDGEEMNVYLAMTSSGGDDIVASIDWIKLAQQRA